MSSIELQRLHTGGPPAQLHHRQRARKERRRLNRERTGHCRNRSRRIIVVRLTCECQRSSLRPIHLRNHHLPPRLRLRLRLLNLSVLNLRVLNRREHSHRRHSRHACLPCLQVLCFHQAEASRNARPTDGKAKTLPRLRARTTGMRSVGPESRGYRSARRILHLRPPSGYPSVACEIS